MKHRSLSLAAGCMSQGQHVAGVTAARAQDERLPVGTEKSRVRKVVLGAAISSALVAGGCASSADSIEARYVSENRYSDLSCSQIAQEMEQVDNRLINLSSRQNDNAGADAALMTVGMIIF